MREQNKKRKKKQQIVWKVKKKNRMQMYCAVRQCVIVGRNQMDYDEDGGLLWHSEVNEQIKKNKMKKEFIPLPCRPWRTTAEM